MTDLFISVDVETDGPIPGANSMLSIGAAAFTGDRRMHGTFSANLELLDGAVPDEDTMKWWSIQGAAWDAHRKNLRHPAHAMVDFIAWVADMTVASGGKPVFVGYPAGFDFTFVYWYLISFVGQSPFAFTALDIKTYAMAVLGADYTSITKRTLGRFMEPDLKHTHVALDDAIEQGYLFLNLRAAREQAL